MLQLCLQSGDCCTTVWRIWTDASQRLLRCLAIIGGLKRSRNAVLIGISPNYLTRVQYVPAHVQRNDVFRATPPHSVSKWCGTLTFMRLLKSRRDYAFVFKRRDSLAVQIISDAASLPFIHAYIHSFTFSCHRINKCNLNWIYNTRGDVL